MKFCTALLKRIVMEQFARCAFLIGIMFFLKEQTCVSSSCKIKACHCYDHYHYHYWGWCYGYTPERIIVGGRCYYKTDWDFCCFHHYYMFSYPAIPLCCDGYGGTNCDIPICGGGASSTSCNRNEGKMIYKDGSIVTRSGGTCTAPMVCENCNYGYYPGSGGYCRACRQIPNCNIKDCTDYSNTVCHWCVGELIRERPGYNVYTGKPDNTMCQRACSWRKKYRCFPGTCEEYIYAKHCQCARGFGGTDCAEATSEKLPDILRQILKLEGDGYVKKLIMDIPTARGKFWTNEAEWKNISIEVSSTYKPEIDPSKKPSYIMGYKIGVDKMTTTATLQRNGDIATWSSNKICYFEERCSDNYTGDFTIMPWKIILEPDFTKPFVHLDTIVFSLETTNGGYVKYEDREAERNYTYDIVGISETNIFELGFDMQDPEHCYEVQEVSTCSNPPLVVNDFNKKRDVPVFWADWRDRDSGIYQITFNVYLMEVKNKTDGKLDYKSLLTPPTVVNYTHSTSAVLQLEEPGPHSVEIIVFDLAGNHKAARRIIMFDDMSTVELQMNPIKVTEANEHFWINKFSKTLELSWNNRFINKRHFTHGWLNEVKYSQDIPLDLEDTDGESNRTISSIHNINGVTRIEIAYIVELNNQTHFNDYTSVSREVFDKQKIKFTEEFKDGKRVTFFVRGVDCMEEFAEDNVTVMIDLSPPVIQNLWLTKGDILNISVHSILELQELTFEWEVYDVHSGIHEVFWRIFDNFTHIDVVHGKSHESPQGEYKTLENCEKLHEDYIRGPNCYCSPYNACYHQHYQIKPQVTNTGNDGLHFGKETGVHDYDYFIEVTAINNARLTTVKRHKITIDVSPPHEGAVHDGIQGEPEVDYQQSLELSAHWDGFFDKESSVWFYMYGFDSRCLGAQDLDIHLTAHINVFQTYETTAVFKATQEGKYFVTVMAYNHALDHSQPVCSDGVTIDSQPAVVSEIVLKGAKTSIGLLKDMMTGDVYVLYRNREIEAVGKPSVECLNRATVFPTHTIQMFPQRRSLSNTKKLAHLDGNCNGLIGVHAELLSYITTVSYLDMSWNVSYSAGSIHDFEVGLASENSIVPDVMDFKSSHHHQHIRIYHPDLFNGEKFFIIIKAETKSSVVDLKVVGPFAVDSTKPHFGGKINVSVESTNNDTFLVAWWDRNAFSDQSDPNPLVYEVSVGSSTNGKDILPFQDLSTGGSCTSLEQSVCSAISVDSLPWGLHGGQQYFIVIKVTNTAGLYITASSDRFSLNKEKATVGVVHDVDITSTNTFVDIDDIDFQASTDKLSVQWTGFEHPYESIRYYACLTNSTSGPYISCSDVSGTGTYTFSGQDLKPYEIYYQVIIAETEAGNVTAISDGVTIVIANDVFDGIEVFDGPLCENATKNDLNVSVSHHLEDRRFVCINDIDYQSSTNRIQGHWIIPSRRTHYLRDLYWSVEEKAQVADIWSQYRPFERLRTFSTQLEESELHLSPGRTYRLLLKFCANQFCFKPVQSDGVTIVPNPPEAGKIAVTYNDENPSIEVNIEPFKDTDIEDLDQSREVMDHYEWAFADSNPIEKLITKWERVLPIKSQFKSEMIFRPRLDKKITFNKCWLLVVRGYTKAGLSTVVSSEIKNCSDINHVRPMIVIDAIGSTLNSDHNGKPVYLDENDIWSKPDEDFTPYSNILSAVWPTLRYKEYLWSVLKIAEEDPTTFYEDSSYLNLRDPCSHPDSIKCGKTYSEYVNIIFSSKELVHGCRYIVCIHANATVLEHEFWNQELEEINTCSDGVTVDLTPPTPADVWIGYERDTLYQTSTSELTVNWNSFIDVEEGGYVAHTSGIKGYEVAVGTTAGGVDTIPFTKVGLTNHKTFHGLHLQSGHTYFATVKAYDFTGQSALTVSNGVKLDTSPPEVTDKTVTITSRHISDLSYIEACWTGVFVDTESGISHVYWSVGTHAGYDDVVAFIESTEECARTPKDMPLSLKEGHAYFVSVKAYNKAGLYKLVSSWAFVVDASPPIAGIVCDGPVRQDSVCSDTDYSKNTSVLQAHWTSFTDPHTTVKEYFITVGSCKTCDDVLTKQSLGIRTDIRLTMLQLAQGIRYYVTITACNTADMCTSASSDGFIVDTTPPLRGVIMDGTVGTDVQYQASNNYLGCKWYTFNDPQSGVSHYTWKVGTTKGGDNILPAVDVHKVEEAFIFDVSSETGSHLPLGIRLYSTVIAFNKAGMFVESSSNGFIVDDSPPIFVIPVALSPIGTLVNGTTLLRSTLKVNWMVEDNESFIETQHLSISSHIGGDFNLTSKTVEGIVRDYTFTDLDLHDGSYYDIILISCNCAKLCTKSILSEILVDSTPPTPGTFAINTDHAASLKRQPDSWMSWTSISISLAWLGFEDVHTGIDSYIVNFGSQYMGNDLNEVAGIPMHINHSSNVSYLEDGRVQTFTFRTQSLTKQKTIHINIAAKNKVGLLSAVVHSKFNLLYGGILELVRRCESHTCLGHCICAPHGQLCKDQSICSDISILGNENSIVEVKDYLDVTFPDDYPTILHSPVDTMLAAKWMIVNEKGKIPQWYEWSVGESSYENPKGIFETSTERIWHDAGQATQKIFTLKRGSKLEEHTAYSFFVRVWYDENTFAVFKSPGVFIYATAPVTTSLRGTAVKEVIQGGSSDLDFVTWETILYADWTGKFIDTAGSIVRFHLYISTYHGGHDIHTLSKDLGSSVTSFNITGLKLEENTKYYTVVQAYNLAGLHTTEVSDGFMLDFQSPTTGIVHDGFVMTDIHATSSMQSVRSFWHGFSDLESGIKNYEYCVSLNDGMCDVDALHDVGIATRKEFTAAKPFEQGSIVRAGVRASDGSGHVSEIVFSNGIVVDVTPPARVKFDLCEDNIIADFSFEHFPPQTNETYCHNISNNDWLISEGTCIRTLNSNMAEQGRTHILLQGSVSQSLSVENYGRYRLTFYTSTIPSDGQVLSAHEGYIEVGNERYIFLMYARPNTGSYEWQKHTFFFHLQANDTNLSIGTVKRSSAFAVDNVVFQLCKQSVTEPAESFSHINAHTVFVHDWSSIHAEWIFIDEETEIVEYLWAIGTVQGGTQLQAFTSVGRRTFANAYSLHFEHNSNVHVTVVAINAAGLRTKSYSSPVIIDLTPPTFRYVHDGPDKDMDIDYQKGMDVVTHWDVFDLESDIEECHWAIGTSKGDTSIQTFLNVDINSRNASKKLSTVPDVSIFSTIRCKNKAGLTSTEYSDGVKILQDAPSVNEVILELMTTSATQFQPRSIYHGNNSEIKFRWTGFRRNEGISSYIIALGGNDFSTSEIVPSSSFGYTYSSFTGLHLDDGEYTVSVTAINEVKMYSQRKSASFYLLTERPILTGARIDTTWQAGPLKATASWVNVFASDHPIFYEVTVRLAEGGEGDLIQWQETTNTKIEIILEADELSGGVTIRFSIRAINYSGLFTTVSSDLFVAP